MTNFDKTTDGFALFIDSELRENRNKLVELLEEKNILKPIEKKKVLKLIERTRFLIQDKTINKGETVFIYDIYKNKYENDSLGDITRLGKLVNLDLSYKDKDKYPIYYNKLIIMKTDNKTIIISKPGGTYFSRYLSIL